MGQESAQDLPSSEEGGNGSSGGNGILGYLKTHQQAHGSLLDESQPEQRTLDKSHGEPAAQDAARTLEDEEDEEDEDDKEEVACCT